MLFLSPHAASLYDNLHIGILASVRRGGRKDILGTKLWAADNECFNGAFEAESFTRWLDGRTQYCDTCRFILAPDVVGDSGATMARFAEWEPKIHGLGLPAALALQDGMTAGTVPWDSLEAVFVGGSTAWKLGRDALAICQQAQERDKWVHVGRVNSIRRIRAFWGVADSFDGSMFDRWHKTWTAWALNYIGERKAQLPLWEVS